jgi:CHAT domain-containing protein
MYLNPANPRKSFAWGGGVLVRIGWRLALLSLYLSSVNAVAAETNSNSLQDLGFSGPMLCYRVALRAASKKLNLVLREEAGGYHGNDQDILFARSLVLMAQSLGDSWLALVGFHYWGNIELYQAKYPSALQHSKAAFSCLAPGLDIDHPSTMDFAALAKIDAKNAAALQLDEIAIIYTNWQKFDSALEYAKAAIALLKQETPGNPALLANATDLCGTAQEQQGHWDQALTAYESARDLLETTLAKLASSTDRIAALDTKLVLADTLRSIGYIKLEHSEHKDPPEALADFQKSLSISEEISTPYEITEGKLALATYYYETGQARQALDWADGAAALARPDAPGNNVDTLWKALSIEGNCLIALQQPAKAEEVLRRAVDVIEGMRQEAGSDRSSKSSFYDSISWFFAEKVGPYLALAQLLADEHRAAEALAYAESSRQRALLDTLVQPATSDAKPQTLPRLNEAELVDRLNQLVPDRDTAIIEYLLGANRGYAFVLTRPGTNLRLKLETVPLAYPEDSQSNSTDNPLQKLDHILDRFRDQVEKSYAGYPRQQADLLFNSLVAPVIPKIEGKTKLVLIPAGKLWDLPFQALPALKRPEHQYLIQDLAISYAPSLMVLYDLRNKYRRTLPDKKWLLAMGNPKAENAGANRVDIGETAAIIEQLQDLLGSNHVQGYTGSAATKARFSAEAGADPVLFLATHAFLNGEDPLSSYFALAPEPNQPDSDRLTASEILSVKLPDRMALLFACDTERGRIVQGEGEIGLAWAFLYGGCPTTLVSQWPVELRATAKLSALFMAGLKEQLNASPEPRFSVSDLLRKAELQLLDCDDFNHPFYWAGFVLLGDDEWR